LRHSYLPFDARALYTFSAEPVGAQTKCVALCKDPAKGARGRARRVGRIEALGAAVQEVERALEANTLSVF